MKPKTMILMGLAIVCGLGASYMTSRLLAERTPVEEEKVEILVAKRNLSVGERIIKPEDLFEKKQVAKENEPPDSIKDLEQLKGKIMKQSRVKGDHIVATNLRGANEGLDIPEGHQAVGLRVSLEGGAHGFATAPKSRVNIIHTVRHQDPSQSYSQMLLENVLVLGADLKYNNDGELASPAQVVTFALNDEDVLKVNLAKELGIMTLSLRKLDDTTKAAKRKFVAKDLDTEKKDEPKQVAAAEPPPVVTPPVVIAEPKVEVPQGTLHSQLIINGPNVQRTNYRVHDNGDVEYDNGQPPQPRTPVAPRPASPSPAVPRDF